MKPGDNSCYDRNVGPSVLGALVPPAAKAKENNARIGLTLVNKYGTVPEQISRSPWQE
jgi:hypothetical protein